MFHLPNFHLPAGLTQYPLSDRQDQTNILSHFEELERGNQALLGVLPTDQRLKPGNLAGFEPHDGLIVEAKLILLDRGPKFAFKLQTVHRASVHALVKYLAACPTQSFCPTHRDV